MTTTTTTYTTTGPVRGSCGHRHKTLRTAVECLIRDQSACKRQGGYSDRSVRYGDGSRLDDLDFLQAESVLADAGLRR